MDPRLEELLRSLGTLGNASDDAARSLGRLAGSTEAQTTAQQENTKETDKNSKAQRDSAERARALGQGFSQIITAAFALNRAVIQLNSRILVATDNLETVSDRINIGFDSINRVLSGLGTVASALGPLGKLIGGTLSTVGKEAILIVQAELTAQVTSVRALRNAFQMTANSFGIVGTDLTNFAEQAHVAGLSSIQFGKILSDNAGSLTEAFGGAGVGSFQMQRAFHAVTRDVGGVGTKFFSLGMEIDDVASEIADFAAMQRRAGGQQILSGQQLASQSYDYMMTLRGLQAITGEDLKSQKEKQRGLMAEAAFRGKMNQVDDDTRKKMLVAGQLAERLGPGARRAFIELETLGNIVSKEAAMYAMAYPEVVKMLQGYSDVVADTSVSQDQVGQALADLNTASSQAIDAERDRIAGSGMLGMQLLTNNSEFLNTLAGNFTAVSDELPKLQTAVKNFRIFLENTDEARRATDPIQEFLNRLRVSDQLVKINEERTRIEEKNVETLSKTVDGMEKLRTVVTNTARDFNEAVTEFTTAISTGRILDAMQALTKPRDDDLNKLKQQAALRIRLAVAELGPGEQLSAEQRVKLTITDNVEKAMADREQLVTDLPIGADQGAGTMAILQEQLDLQRKQNEEFLDDLGKLIEQVYKDSIEEMQRMYGVDPDVGSNSNTNTSNMVSLMEQSVNLNDQILDTLKQNNKTGKQMVRAING